MNGSPNERTAAEGGVWRVGLVSDQGKYLTAETFGFKINASGNSFKRKQTWCLLPSGSGGCVCLRSHLNRYLAVDQFGNVACDLTDRDADAARFQLSFAPDGRWLFRNLAKGYYLGCAPEKVVCESKNPGPRERWTAHLASNPQVNVRSVGRKRFLRLDPAAEGGGGGELRADANVAWGPDTLFALEFRDGKYTVRASSGDFLSSGGELLPQCSRDCLFVLEYHGTQFSLKDVCGNYLAPVGSKAVLRARSRTVTKDELFQLEETSPQACLASCMNSRYVSVKQGVDLTANQDEIGESETFQLEFVPDVQRWYIRTMQDKYWVLEASGGVQASGSGKNADNHFELLWGPAGKVQLRAANGKFVSTKKSGHLYTSGAEPTQDNAQFHFYLLNRPLLILKCDQGFVGAKSGAGAPKLECNKASYDRVYIERGDAGRLFFRGADGRFWHRVADEIHADAEDPEGFYMEVLSPSRMLLKTACGKYLTAGTNGRLSAVSDDRNMATKWEY